jgi:hypothetical protein
MSTTPETTPGIASVSEISERYIEEFSVVGPTLRLTKWNRWFVLAHAISHQQ